MNTKQAKIKTKPNSDTVEELVNLLCQYPSDMKVNVVIGNKIRPLSNITMGVDMDTNEASIWLIGKD